MFLSRVSRDGSDPQRRLDVHRGELVRQVLEDVRNGDNVDVALALADLRVPVLRDPKRRWRVRGARVVRCRVPALPEPRREKPPRPRGSVGDGLGDGLGPDEAFPDEPFPDEAVEFNPDDKSLEIEFTDTGFEDGATWTATIGTTADSNSAVDDATVKVSRSWSW